MSRADMYNRNLKKRVDFKINFIEERVGKYAFFLIKFDHKLKWDL